MQLSTNSTHFGHFGHYKKGAIADELNSIKRENGGERIHKFYTVSTFHAA
jgi:hypothetical protein